MKWLFFLLTCFAIFLFVVDLSIGAETITLHQYFDLFLWNTDEGIHTIVYKIRLPRIITAMIAGMALSAGGLQMQTVFRNPLAGPYVLGISAGASFGVAILLMGLSIFSINSESFVLTNWSIIISAWIGAGVVLAIIFAVSAKVKDIMTILILGVLFGSAVSAIVSILQYYSNANKLKIFILWTMGSFSGVSINQLQILVPSVLIGIFIALISSKWLNALLLGENFARTIGLNVKQSRLAILLSTGILTGSITAFCGPIGFVGIAVPHISRMLFKTANHLILMPACLLIGIIIMLLSDIVSQLPGYDKVLPISSITALIGIPVIIWIIVRNKKI